MKLRNKPFIDKVFKPKGPLSLQHQRAANKYSPAVAEVEDEEISLLGTNSFNRLPLRRAWMLCKSRGACRTAYTPTISRGIFLKVTQSPPPKISG